MVVLAFHVGALTYFNTLKCSHASLHPGKAGSCKQPLNTSKHGRTVHRRSVRNVKKQRTHRHDMKFPWSALFPCRFIKQSTINSTILLQMCKDIMNRRQQTPFNSREKPVKRPNYLESLFGFHVESSCPFFLYEE